VIVAPDELARGEVVARDLATGTQSTIAIDQIDLALKERLS